MKRILITVIMGVCAFCGLSNYIGGIQKDIANNVIRLHVIANSNDDYDQKVKLRVRDRVISDFGNSLNGNEDIEIAKKYIKNNLFLIESTVNDELLNWDYPYKAKVKYGQYNFPTKTYENIRLPAGPYEAVRVVIGSGEGENWWCVLFPPLCFVSGVQGDINDGEVNHGEMTETNKEILEDNMSSEEYETIDNTKPVVFKFKLIEWWFSIKSLFTHQ